MPNVQRPIKETGAICEHELQRLWPLNLKERKAKIAQFAKETRISPSLLSKGVVRHVRRAPGMIPAHAYEVRSGKALPVEVTLAFKLGIKVVIQTNGYIYSIPNTARTGHAGYWPPKYTGEHWPARIALTHSLLSDSLNGIER